MKIRGKIRDGKIRDGKSGTVTYFDSGNSTLQIHHDISPQPYWLIDKIHLRRILRAAPKAPSPSAFK